jgi:serine/threonine protein kinase
MSDSLDRQAIVNQVLATPIADRSAFLDSICSGDEKLRKEIETLISDIQKQHTSNPNSARGSSPTRIRTTRIQGKLRQALRSNYILQERIGSGGMGDLYLAKHKTLGGKWAIKVLAEDLAKEPRVVERFVNEARIEANLQHPNIVKVFTIGHSGPYHYFVMNYIEGEDLSERLERSAPLSDSESVSIAFQICRALECAHDHNICHRDLKPSNVRIDRYGTIFVLDFGIARARDAVISSQTREGERLGTPLYMSPEQIKGQPVDARSDLYSLGVLFYEMVTGVNPFQADSGHAVYSKHLYHIPQAPIELNPRIKPALSELILRLLEKEAHNRIQSAKDLCVLLRPMREITEVTPPIGQGAQLPATMPYERRLTHVLVRMPETLISRELSPEETKVLALTDGKKTVGEVLALSQLDPGPFFAALENLKSDVVIQTVTGPEELISKPSLFRMIQLRISGLSMRNRYFWAGACGLLTCGILAAFLHLGTFSKGVATISPAAIEFDASPFAIVTVRDHKGVTVVEKRVTPFLVKLEKGDYVAEFVHDSDTKRRSFRIDSSKRLSTVREDFWTEQDVGNLFDQSVK